MDSPFGTQLRTEVTEPRNVAKTGIVTTFDGGEQE